MQIKKNEIRTGILVLVSMSLLILLVVWLGAPGLVKSFKTFHILFDNAAGMKPGAHVLLAGRNIGQVTKLISPVPMKDRPAENKKYEVMIDEKEKIYYDQKRLIEKLMFEMQAHTHGSTYSIPKIAFIVEQDIEAYFYKQTPVWNEELNKTDKTWWAFQDHSVVQLYEEWIDWYWKRDDAKNLYFQAITNDSKIESTMKQKQYQRRKIKFWPKGNNITSSTWVIGNYLILVVTNQKPNYLVEIHDTVLANNTRELLKGIWDQI
jgi:hypothetical protein